MTTQNRQKSNAGLVTASSDDAVKDIKLQFLSLFSVKYVFFILRMLFLFLSMFSNYLFYNHVFVVTMPSILFDAY